MMLLNQMMILYAKPQRLWRMVPQQVHKHSSLSFLRRKVPVAMEKLCLQKINHMKMKIRRLSVEDLCGEIRHVQKLGCANIFLAQSQRLMFVKLQLFCAFLSSRNFPIL